VRTRALAATVVAATAAHAAGDAAPRPAAPVVALRAHHMVLDAAVAGPWLLAATHSGRVERFAWREGRAIAPLLVLPPAGEGLLAPTIRSVAASPSGRRVAIAASDGLLRLLELDPAGEPRARREVASGDAVACRFVGEERVATGTLGGEVALVAFADGRTLRRRHVEWAPVQAIAVDPGAARLAVAFQSSAVRILGSEDLEPRALLVGHRDAVFALAWPTASSLYSGSQDKRLLAWDPRSAEPPFRELQRADGYVTALAADAASGRVAYATGEGRIGVFRAMDAFGRVERVLEGHSAPVQAMAFADSGRRLISAGNDARVLVWDLGSDAAGGPR